MELALGTTFPVFVLVTVVVMGFAALMMGHTMAITWKPIWHPLVYSVFMGFADRFLTYALFEGKLLLLSGYVIDTAVIFTISLVAYQISKARKMVNQYPWLYERVGLFGWREKGPAETTGP